MPLRPNAAKSATPPTTGGSTSGTVTIARTTPIPGKRNRASIQASGHADQQRDSGGLERGLDRQPQRRPHTLRAVDRAEPAPRHPHDQRERRQQQEQRSPAAAGGTSATGVPSRRAAARVRAAGSRRGEAVRGQHRAGRPATGRRRRRPWPAPGSSPTLSGRDRVLGRGVDRARDRDALDLAAGAADVGDVDQPGVDLAGFDDGEGRLDVRLAGASA